MSMMLRKYRVHVFSALLALVNLCILIPFVAHAQTSDFVPLAQTEGSKLGQLYSTTDGNLSNFINGLFKFGIAIGAIIAVLRLAYAGFLYMGSADMWSSKSEAKKILADVTLGLLILLSIYLILYQINPDIVKLKALDVIKSTPATPASQNFNPGPGSSSAF